jgi:hypothetical protein
MLKLLTVLSYVHPFLLSCSSAAIGQQLSDTACRSGSHPISAAVCFILQHNVSFKCSHNFRATVADTSILGNEPSVRLAAIFLAPEVSGLSRPLSSYLCNQELQQLFFFRQTHATLSTLSFNSQSWHLEL